MINARRAALLGLTTPLSPIMIAVLGLWPEPDDAVVVPPPQINSGGPDAPPSRDADHDWQEERRRIANREWTEQEEILQAVLGLIFSGAIA